MKIESIAFRTPSLAITNEQIIEFVDHYNPGLPKKSLAYYEEFIRRALAQNGCQVRYFRDKGKEETALEMIQGAFSEAVYASDVDPSEIDLMIYCGVGRGFLEPANAYFVAASLGLNCNCYDLTDACMSWVRALEIAQLYLQSGTFKTIALINGEFNAYEHGFPELFKIDTLRGLKHAIPAFTIGEAATCTILSNAGGQWDFKFKSLPQYAGLCNIPVHGYQDYLPKENGYHIREPSLFSSDGAAMSQVVREHFAAFIREQVEDFDSTTIWFPHLASMKVTTALAGELNVLDKLHTESYRQFGNIVSATIPTSIKLAIDAGKLGRGDRVILCPGSAGMSFAIADFIF